MGGAWAWASGGRRIPLLQRQVSADEPLRIAIGGSQYWPFPEHIWRWLDSMLFLVGDPKLLQVWVSADGGGTVNRAAWSWLDETHVRRRRFHTQWSADCRPECSHRPRGPEDICHFAARYRDEAMVAAGPDLCKTWNFNREDGKSGTPYLLAAAQKAGIPFLVTKLTDSMMSRRDRAQPKPEPAPPSLPSKSVLANLPDGPILDADLRKAVLVAVRELYEGDESWSVPKLARHVGRSTSTMWRWLDAAGTNFRPKRGGKARVRGQ